MIFIRSLRRLNIMRKLLAFLFAFGLFLVVWILWDMAFLPSASEMVGLRAAIASWPSLEGRLAEMSIEAEIRGWGRQMYFAEALYYYTVDKESHSGSRIGIDPLRSDNIRSLENYLLRLVPAESIKSRSGMTGIQYRIIVNEE